MKALNADAGFVRALKFRGLEGSVKVVDQCLLRCLLSGVWGDFWVLAEPRAVGVTRPQTAKADQVHGSQSARAQFSD